MNQEVQTCRLDQEGKNKQQKRLHNRHDFLKYCYECHKAVDLSNSVGNHFHCSECGVFICKDCVSKALIYEVDFTRHPSLFRKGRKQKRSRCPSCWNIVSVSESRPMSIVKRLEKYSSAEKS